MIVVDLDDSLLGNDLKISQANQRALLSAVEKGVLVTIATGRMFCSTLPYIHQLEINVPVITYQGALIKNALSGEVMLERALPMEYTHQLIEDCKENGVHLQAYLDDNYFYAEENASSRLYHRLSGIKGTAVGDLALFLKREPTKLLIIDEPSKIVTLREKYEEMFHGAIQVTISKPNYLEFTHIEATKGKAIEHLSTMYDISRNEIIAIGDSYNDISMIEYAGLGVAMGNAPDAVKEISDYVTRGNDEDGVAEVIEAFVLGGEKR